MLMDFALFQFAPSFVGQPPNNVNASSQFQPISQMHVSSVSVAPLQQTSQQPPFNSAAVPVSLSLFTYIYKNMSCSDAYFKLGPTEVGRLRGDGDVSGSQIEISYSTNISNTSIGDLIRNIRRLYKTS